MTARSGQEGSIIVVGGGVVGCATAYYLAQRGFRVAVVEREHVAWAASGRNAGYLSTISRSAGPELDLARAGRELYDHLAEELDEFDFRACGSLAYFFEEQAAFMETFAASRRGDGLLVDLLTGDEARSLCPILADDVAGALYGRMDAFIHPQKLALALARGAERFGAQIRHGETVEALEVSGGRCRGVRTRDGVIGCDAVIVAAGPWTRELLEATGLDFQTQFVRLALAETEPFTPSFGPILYGPTILRDYMLVRNLPGFDEELFTHPLQRAIPGVALFEMVAQRADGRLLVGCPIDVTESFVDRPSMSSLATMFAVLCDHLPALQSVIIDRAWSGVLGETMDALPVIGAVPSMDGLFVAAGLGFGAMAGPVTGKLIAELVATGKASVDITPYRYDREAVTEGIGRSFVSVMHPDSSQ